MIFGFEGSAWLIWLRLKDDNATELATLVFTNRRRVRLLAFDLVINYLISRNLGVWAY